MCRFMFGQVISNRGKVLLFNSSFPFISGRPQFHFLSRTPAVFKKQKDDLGHTTVILQDGLEIQELPAIVRKVKDVGLVNLRNFNSTNKTCEAENTNGPDITLKDDESQGNDSCKVTEKTRKDFEAHEIIEGFNRCYTAKGVYLLLETIPDEEVNTEVALFALKKIVELENNEHFRNAIVRSGEAMPENFTKAAIFNQLIDIIISGSDSAAVLEALKIVSRELISGSNTFYREKLCNELMIRVTDGKFNILQFCEVVKVFSTFSHVQELKDNVDKLWVGLVDKEKSINETNIVEVFRILPLLKQSRRMVFNILEKKLNSVWWRMTGSAVAEVLSVLCEVKINSPRILGILSRWTNTNIHAVKEDELLEIVTGFNSLDYMDKGIEKALERYVKAKGIKIKNAAVMAAIVDYCGHFRIRSPLILQGCAEYLIHNGASLSPVLIKTMFTPFGFLDFLPSNGRKFWQVFETVVDEKFVQFRPEDAIDVMLACVFLEKHPLNFVTKIFNPYFLDRLHSLRDLSLLHQMRTKLKLFDTAMTLECPNYRGPMLPRDQSAQTMWQDGRVRRAANQLLGQLEELVGGPDVLSTSVLLPQLPMCGLYVIDLLVHPAGMGGSNLRFTLRHDRGVHTAILLHLPEHYCHGSQHLVGPQVMRKRHFRRLGLRVVGLEYNILCRLRMHPTAYREYLVEQLRQAEDPL